jgi:hypothetical protein
MENQVIKTAKHDESEAKEGLLTELVSLVVPGGSLVNTMSQIAGPVAQAMVEKCSSFTLDPLIKQANENHVEVMKEILYIKDKLNYLSRGTELRICCFSCTCRFK